MNNSFGGFRQKIDCLILPYSNGRDGLRFGVPVMRKTAVKVITRRVNLWLTVTRIRMMQLGDEQPGSFLGDDGTAREVKPDQYKMQNGTHEIPGRVLWPTQPVKMNEPAF